MSEPAILEYHKDGYTISTDKTRLDIPVIHSYLSDEAYWSQGIPLEIVERGIKNSLCFGLYQGETQAGFARVISDYASFAYLCDVFILEPFRRQGLGKWLMACVCPILHCRVCATTCSSPKMPTVCTPATASRRSPILNGLW